MSMEEALTTGPAHCPNHKVHNDSAQASELCMHISSSVQNINTHLSPQTEMYLVSLKPCVTILNFTSHILEAL